MLKVVKRPKEYIAIKVPEVCEDVGKIVSEEADKAGILLDITTYYAIGRRWAIEVGVKNDEAQTVKRGSIIVCKISQDGSKYPEAVDVMGQEEFDKKFKPVDDPAKASPIVVDVDAKPILNKLKEIKAEMSTKIEGVALPDHANVPHVRIEFDDINDVPHVWIDGKRIDRSDTALVSVSLDWHTKDPAATDHDIRAYKIEYLKGDHREGIAQGSAMGPDHFKNDIHAK
ncbi:hypothetical protein [uncultured Lacticaseibacillus sp.]|uniref:hypothetical protein n=1 Tax=uncultured Lacticaseibacillus sp. TaxID=2775882 RepID=UPI00258C3EA5|nr:hypothetical protein [uncultured Lacticaseibacillus sp.]